MTETIDMIFTCIAIVLGACGLAFFVWVLVLMSKGYITGGRGLPEAPPKWNSGKDNNQ